MLNRHYRRLFTGSLTAAALCLGVAYPAFAEDCTGILPAADCTLDENTTAPLTIDNGVTLFTSGSITIDHDIDGSAVVGDGIISTTGAGDTITQTGDIGSTTAIDQLVINGDDIWITSGSIVTDNSGLDIDLGTGDGGEELRFLSGGSVIGEIDGHSLDFVTFGADGNGGTYDVLGQIESVGVVLNSGNLTLNGTVGGGVPISSLTVNSGTTLNMNANVTSNGALDIDGAVNIAAGRRLSGDSYVSDADGATYTMGVAVNDGVTSNASIAVASGGPVDMSNDTVYISVGDTSEPLSAQTVNALISGNGGATVLPTLVDTSYMYDFTLQQDADDIDLIIAVRSLDDLTSNRNNNVMAAVILEDFADSTNSAINRIQSLLGNDPNSNAFNERLESLMPVLDEGYADVSRSLVRQTQSSIEQRLIHNRYFEAERQALLKPETVFISGEKNMKSGEVKRHDLDVVEAYKGTIWGTTFYDGGGKSGKDVDGHSFGTAGMIAGFEVPEVRDDLIFGGAVTLAKGSVKSKNANSANTDITSVGVSLYGGQTIYEDTLFSAILSYMHGENDTTRHNVGGIASNIFESSFKSEQLSMKTVLSRNFLRDDLNIRPRVYMSYDYISSDSFFESPLENRLKLRTRYSSLQKLAAGFGVDVGKYYMLKNGMLVYPNAHISYDLAMINDRLKAVSTINSTDVTLHGDDPSDHNLNLGMNVTVQQENQLHYNTGYLMHYDGDDYDHSVSMNLVYDF